MINADTFTIEVRGSAHADLNTAIVEGLAEIWQRPPCWVADPSPTRISLGVLPSPRAKVRSRLTAARHWSQLADLAVARPGTEVTGAVLEWAPGVEQPAVNGEQLWTSVSVGGGGGRSLWQARGFVGHARDDPRFGESVLAIAATMIEHAGVVEWGAGWFGDYGVPPFVEGNPEFRYSGVVPGYSLLVCLNASAVQRLGGDAAVDAAPAMLHRRVTSSTGDRWTIAVLAPSISDVSDELLMRWREFLRPVLPWDSIAKRLVSFKKFNIDTNDHRAGLPPMILAEDWPS